MTIWDPFVAVHSGDRAGVVLHVAKPHSCASCVNQDQSGVLRNVSSLGYKTTNRDSQNHLKLDLPAVHGRELQQWVAWEAGRDEWVGRAHRIARLLVDAAAAGLWCPAAHLRSLIACGALLPRVNVVAEAPTAAEVPLCGSQSSSSSRSPCLHRCLSLPAESTARLAGPPEPLESRV